MPIEIRCDKPIVMIPVGELKPNPKNPNVHSDAQVARIAKIIEGNGFRRPITVSNQTGFMVVGHGRLMAAKKLGMTHVPVSYQDYENDGLEFADMVADNASADGAELDMSAIHAALPDLAPFDIDLLGFQDFQLSPSGVSFDESGDAGKNDQFRLEILFSNYPAMNEVYEELLSRNLLVRVMG